MKHPDLAALARAARDETGLPLAQFAALIGASRRAAHDWETGEKPPNGTTIVLLKLIRDGRVAAEQIKGLKP